MKIIDTERQFYLYRCPNCSAPAQISNEATSVTCEYCGYTSLVAPSQREQLESNKMVKSSQRERNIVLTVVLLPIMIVFFIFMCYAFSEGYRISGVIGLFQCGCMIGALAAGLGKKTSGKKIALVAILILASFTMVIPYFGFVFKEDDERIERNKMIEEEKQYVSVDKTWPTGEIGKITPKPVLEEADIWENNESSLSLRVTKVSEKFFMEYREECIKAGFTKNVKEHDTAYEAYTDEGYHLNVFLTDEKELFLTVKAPIKMEHYLWPEAGVGSLLPEPSIEFGKILEERNRSFRADLYQVTEEAFEEYIKACQKAGFTQEEYRTNNSFKASDQEGNWVDLFRFDDFYQTVYVTAGIAEDTE